MKIGPRYWNGKIAMSSNSNLANNIDIAMQSSANLHELTFHRPWNLLSYKPSFYTLCVIQSFRPNSANNRTRPAPD